MSSPVIKWATWSQLIQLCGHAESRAGNLFVYRADFLPTQLDQLTSSGAFFSFIDWTLPFYIIFTFYGRGPVKLLDSPDYVYALCNSRSCVYQPDDAKTLHN
jgi:hypothetical protein